MALRGAASMERGGGRDPDCFGFRGKRCYKGKQAASAV